MGFVKCPVDCSSGRTETMGQNQPTGFPMGVVAGSWWKIMQEKKSFKVKGISGYKTENAQGIGKPTGSESNLLFAARD